MFLPDPDPKPNTNPDLLLLFLQVNFRIDECVGTGMLSCVPPSVPLLAVEHYLKNIIKVITFSFFAVCFMGTGITKKMGFHNKRVQHLK